MRFHLFTDGACQPNPGKGGWAFISVIMDSRKRVIQSGHEAQTTNNRMEITAVLKGLKYVIKVSKDRPRIMLYADSQYVLKTIGSWLQGWSKNNWKRKDKKPVLNADLWKQIHKILYEDEKVLIESCVHVKGHSGHSENEECDQLAVAEIQKHK